MSHNPEAAKPHQPYQPESSQPPVETGRAGLSEYQKYQPYQPQAPLGYRPSESGSRGQKIFAAVFLTIFAVIFFGVVGFMVYELTHAPF